MILTGTVLAALAVLYGAVAVFLIARLKLSPRQALLYVPFKLIYRIRDRAVIEARATASPVIYVVTHRSRLDPALMLMLLPEDTLHILDAYSATASWLEPFRGLARTITFNAEHVFVSRRLVRVLKGKGRLAVYIPEDVEPGLRPFRLFRAVSRIAMQADARIIPVFVGGARALPLALGPPTRTRRRFPRLSITMLAPMPISELTALSGSPSTSASNAVFDRVAEARVAATTRHRSLFSAINHAARRAGPDRVIIEDGVSGAMTYRRMLIVSRIFAGRFARRTAPDEVVGIMLPNTNALALSFTGLMSAGRTAAMINYTAGAASVTAGIGTALIRTVISSRAFVGKAGLAEIVAAIEAGGARMVWLEDLRDGITTFDKAVAALFWRRAVGRQDEKRAAVVMFTSGSEGMPKAVVLSHANLVANAMQIESRIAIGPGDRLMNVLPAFHSFGLTGGLVLPLLAGVRVMLYPSPLHYRAIPKIATKYGSTVIVGTDTFLTAYADAAEDGDFAGVRLAVAGGEPLRDETRRVWRERFGVPILQGYGMTEASPVVAINTATHGRDGTLGRLLPGMRMKLEPVDGVAEGGRLWLAGPSIMMGYMSAERPGIVQPPSTEWHDSGDIVTVDRDGFLTIRGRVKRFAKIAGEMVSLGAVEMLVHSLWPDARHAAVAVPDARRGERIVLVTTAAAPDMAALRRHIRKAGGTEIMVPRDVVVVAGLPTLAMGKTDYRATRRLALERLGIAAAA